MASTPIVQWRFVLCTNMGVPISLIDGVAADMELEFRLNRPGMATFSVPSEDPRVNLVFGSDNRPYLCVRYRALKAYRKVGEDPGGWSLKFAGRVWSLEDHGDGDTVRTMVTCYDPLKILEKRVVRTGPDANGNNGGRYDIPVQWYTNDEPSPGEQGDVDIEVSGESGSKVIKDMIERTRRYGGLAGTEDNAGQLAAAGLEDAPVHIETGLYGWVNRNSTWEITPPVTLTYDPGTYVLPSIIQICNTMTVDLVPTYLDVQNGVFLRIGAKPYYGHDRRNQVILAYAASPYTASEFVRTQSMDSMANMVHLYGKKAPYGQSGFDYDSVSQDEQHFLVMEQVENLSGITNQKLLNQLATMRVHFQKRPRDIITVVPTPEGSPLPWDDYYVGDLVTIQASENISYPVTREHVEGVQRVYGIRVSIDNDFGEYVSEMIVSPDESV